MDRNKNQVLSTIIFLIMLLIAITTNGGVKSINNLSVVIQTLLIYLGLLKFGTWMIKKIQVSIK